MKETRDQKQETSDQVPQSGLRVRHVASLWTLRQHPSADRPWTVAQGLDAIADAGFHGVTGRVDAAVGEAARARGLEVVGFISSGDIAAFPDLLREQRAAGARVVNVQLADHDTPTEEALRLWLALLDEGERQGLTDLSLEVHRDTCTETPEKTDALAERFREKTGRLLKVTWDFSHFAVVKHLAPGDYADRLLTHPELLGHSNQLHLRPFNGHHAQVPVTGREGGLSRELQNWLPFATACLRLWHDQNRGQGRELYVVPEMGPVSSGYCLEGMPDPWEDAKRLREILAGVCGSLGFGDADR